MKINKGRIIILIAMLLTALLWWVSTPMETISVMDQLSHIIAGLSLTGLVLVFVMSVRSKTMDRWFGGLDRIYNDHKWLAIISVILIFIHGRISESIAEAAIVGEAAKSLSAALGSLGQFAFIILTLVALFAKKLKYEHWRFIHRLMVIPYLFGLYHTYVSSKYDLFTLTPLALWVGITSIIGMTAGIYTILIYQKSAFDYKGQVSEVVYMNESVVELELTLDKAMTFSSGQYVFIKVFQEGIEAAPHPFTIARGQGDKMYLAIKKLGDGTKDLYDKITTGTRVKVDGPYGQFDFQEGKDKQVWIAGGIGITAFIAYLERGNTDREIELFYTFRGKKEAVYRDLLEAYASNHSNFMVHFHNTSDQERLEIKEAYIAGDVTVYLCGPEKMIQHYTKAIKLMKKDADVRYEEFGFAR